MRPQHRLSTLALTGLFAFTMTSSPTGWLTGHGGYRAMEASASESGPLSGSQRGDKAFHLDGPEPEGSTIANTDIPTTTTVLPATTVAPAPPATQAPAPPASTPATTKAPVAKRSATPAPPVASVAPQKVNASSSTSVNTFLLNAVNNERQARGLAPLALDSTLSKIAQNWSSKMAASGAMSHSGTGIPNGFNAYGENVLKATSGTSAGAMHNLWMNSSGHRQQMLQPGYDRIGIAAVCVDGSVYATEAFGQSSSASETELSDEVPSAGAKAPASGGPTCS